MASLTSKALSRNRRVEIVEKKKLVAAALNKDDKTFVVHIAAIMGAMARATIQSPNEGLKSLH